MNISTDSTLSRRTALRGAVVVGGALWAAPVVTALAPPAYATGSCPPGGGFSEVALVAVKDGTYYRVKYEFDASKATIDPSGNIDSKCSCGLYGTRKGFPARTYGTGSYKAFPTLVTTYSTKPDGGFTVALPAGYLLVAFFVHQGECCFVAESATPFSGGSVVAGTPPSGGCAYAVSIKPSGSGTLVSFPLAPNMCPSPPPCTGGK